MNNTSCIYLQEDENYSEEKSLNENKILLKDENKLKKIKKKKKKRENENEKIVLFENNDIVEYDANYLCTKNNHIVLLEEDYLSILEHLIEKKYYPDIKKLKNELISRTQDNNENLMIIDENYNGDLNYSSDNVKDLKTNFEEKENITSYDILNQCNNNNNSLLLYSDKNDFTNENENYKLVILPNGKKHRINLNMNLRDFQKKYTSEDNKSFEYLLKKMKNKCMEKNLYSISKRSQHNLLMEKIEDYTKKGVNCHILNTNKSENELYSMMFSSSFKVSNIDNIKKSKLKICCSNTRFSQEYNEDIEKQINQSGEIKELKLLKKEKENKEDKMIEQGKFNLLTRNNQYEYVKTPLIQAGKGIDKSPIITWGNIINTPKLIENENENENEKNEFCDESNSYRSKQKENEEDEGNVYIKNEFNLQKINKREIIAEKLQNSLKNIKYNKEILKKKNINFLINKNYSSRMSSTSFKNSVLSRQSQKRLSELALKSSLVSQILNKKKKKIDG
ncbi:ES2 protein, putative [Plasmodium relictum]|uniref:ES2 protein, putative n=1 Tax=Plasmodium relictum TaxID=85471 RepID=A0A1J1H5Z2_PLARL|nr:ES2 protein, putative [Plasmodium relictum]CRG99979.1 ES2 protein, putative [Plasmodium relictum]